MSDVVFRRWLELSPIAIRVLDRYLSEHPTLKQVLRESEQKQIPDAPRWRPFTPEERQEARALGWD